MTGTKGKSLWGVVGAILLARILQAFLPDLPVWVRLVFGASFWLAIVVVVPVTLWHVFRVIKEYRAKKRSRRDAIVENLEVAVSTDRRVEPPPARTQRPTRFLSPNWVVALTVAATIVGVAIGWFGARSWDLPEIRLARHVEQAKRNYFECATAAERLFDTQGPSTTRARTSVDKLWQEAAPSPATTAPSAQRTILDRLTDLTAPNRDMTDFVEQRCQREREEVDAMALAITLIQDRRQ